MTGRLANRNDIFLNPGAAYRAKPFWAWNGTLEEGELRRQVKVLKAMGFGGAFMHSRVGLNTKYLSDEWFRLVNASADECRANGLEAWMYDEDRWPSGAAGGLATKDPKYRMRMLRMTVADAADYKAEGGELAVFVARMEGIDLLSYRRVPAAGRPKPERDETILSFKVRLEDNSSWYNGLTYLDTMSAAAVETFIATTYDAYAKHCGARFGKTMPGIFTDEPNYGFCITDNSKPNTADIPWTGELLRTFKRRHGYDLADTLPEVFLRFNGAAFSKPRHDYTEICTHLFVTHFTRKLYAWCAKHKVALTGHVLSEESLHNQTRVVGSAMRSYEYMQVPGVDILAHQGLTREANQIPQYLTVKQCSSVASQFGRKWMLSELYGCTGWHFTFAEYKAVGDWQAALGVNLRCPHHSWYTLEGEAKRDYPASIFFQSPWWRDFPLVEDYFSRLNVALTQGRAVRDVAVIHPVESAWGIAYREPVNRVWMLPQGREGNQDHPIAILDAQLKTVQQFLLEEHHDFEYVDEDILSRHGAVKNGRFRVAKSSYSTVIVPPAHTLKKRTCELLAQFAAAGGHVVFVKPTPALVEAEPCDRMGELLARGVTVGLDRTELLAALSRDPLIRRVAVKTSDGQEYNACLTMLRQDKTGRTIVFICHTLQDVDSGEVTIDIPAAGTVQEWDAVTGERCLVDARKTASGVTLKTVLHGGGSRLFVVDPKRDGALRKRASLKEIRRHKILCGKMKVVRDEPNAFPLERPEYAIDGGRWRRAKDVLKVDEEVRDVAGWAHRGGAMVQPWVQKETPKSKAIPVGLRYAFEVEAIPAGACHLVMERPEKSSVTLNGVDLCHTERDGWWIDPSFKKLPVPPGTLRMGRNELIVTTRYGQKDNLEAVYFTGEFGFRWVDGMRPVVIKLPAELTVGDWGEQGFPCYSGAMTYVLASDLTPGRKEKTILEVHHWGGALIKIRVNGKQAGRIAYKPYELDITACAVKGRNVIEVEIVSSRRNLLGPLHLTETWQVCSDEYARVPYGLMGEPFISIRR